MDVLARYKALEQFSKEDARLQFLRILRSLPYGARSPPMAHAFSCLLDRWSWREKSVSACTPAFAAFLCEGDVQDTSPLPSFYAKQIAAVMASSMCRKGVTATTMTPMPTQHAPCRQLHLLPGEED